MILEYNTVHGQLWRGDCLTMMNLLATLPDFEPFDLILTDPPYGTTACKWDSVIPFAPMWSCLDKMIKPNGAVVLFGSEPFSSALRMSNIKNYKYDWVWNKSRKTGFQMARKRPMKEHENVLVFYNRQPTYNQELKKLDTPLKSWRKNGKGGSLLNAVNTRTDRVQEWTGFNTDIIKISSEHNRSGNHPTQKPVALMEYFIRTYTNEGDRVLDFTSGSGTTGIGCINTGRKFTLIENDTEHGYIETTIKRLEEATL